MQPVTSMQLVLSLTIVIIAADETTDGRSHNDSGNEVWIQKQDSWDRQGKAKSWGQGLCEAGTVREGTQIRQGAGRQKQVLAKVRIR